MTGIVAIAQRSNPARDLVNPFIGTGGHGHTFPGACVPNGLVQLSPDTRTDGYNDWDGASGYHYSDSVIYGFSHTHLSGTGVSDLCDVLLMPMRGFHSSDPNDYHSPFRKETEQAHAGYYSVHLDQPDVRAELTATKRVGVHRYSMPPSLDLYLLIDLRHRDQLLNASFTITPNNEVVGTRRSSSWASDQQLFFVIQFSKPISIVNADSANAAVLVHNDGTPLIVKVAISAVSIEGARTNLEAEVPHWDFDHVRAEAEAAWNAKLNKIQVEGGTREEQRIFYTALYHCYVAPYIFNDVDGRYRGMDGDVHHADHDVYTVFSLWDTFRALHPLMTILEPDMTRDWINTFLLHYQQGERLPVWELWGNETDCMIGYHSVSVIADAYLKGIRGFDEELALEAMMASAMRDDPGLNAYRTKGHISSEDAPECVSKTLEYAYDDWCIAQMARALLRRPMRTTEQETRWMDLHQTFRTFRERSTNWRNLLDPVTGFFRARRNGGLLQPFDPYEVNFNFTEANAWQYSHFPPQDFHLLSSERLTYGIHPVAFLDSVFAASSITSGRDQADITGLIGQYAHGNEPSHHMAYLYTDLGLPERTRALVRRILNEQYHDAPDGLSGNEDCGQMSAWYVMSALGMYQTAPGDPVYTLGYPLFKSARVDVGRESPFTVLVSDSTWALLEADEDVAGPPLVDDREPVSRFMNERSPYITHSTISHGSTIRFDRDRVPEKRVEVLRTEDWKRPPQSNPVAPFIQARSMAFRDSLRIELLGHGSSAAMLTIATAKDTTTLRYAGPFTIRSTSTISAAVEGAPVSNAVFTQIDDDRTITLESTYANQYSAGGANALVDGLRGGNDFRTGQWQGFQGQDLVAMVDLGAIRTVDRIGIGLLQDQKSWIFMPGEVTIAWSTNKRQWSSRTIANTVDPKAGGSITTELWTEALGKKARYISIVAKSIGPCPDWHPGKGGRTWIFADEVLIEQR